MPEGLISSAAGTARPADRRIYGVAIAQVKSNLDLAGLGRVQLRLPWLPDVEPWARVAVLLAGSNRGTFFIPQEGDEVLVAFNQGNIQDPIVLGCLWNGQDKPPTQNPLDATNKRIIRTPLGHEIELDDQKQSITITSSTKHKVTIEPSKIEVAISGGNATITLGQAGNVSIEAKTSLQLKAETLSLEAKSVTIKGQNAAVLDGGQACTVKGGTVMIN